MTFCILDTSMSAACSIGAGVISVFLKEGEMMGSCATAQNRGWRSMSLDLKKIISKEVLHAGNHFYSFR